MLGGLDWQGLHTVAELLGVQDIEALIADLIVIREWRKEQNRNG